MILNNVARSFKKMPKTSLFQSQCRRFGSLSILQRGFLMSKLTKIFASRGGIYRLLLIGCLVQLGATLSGSYLIQRPINMSIKDYLEGFAEEAVNYQIHGVLVPGSIEIERGTLMTKFKITDFENELDVLFKGSSKFEFKEGETILLTAYTPDLKNKNFIHCVDYQINHAMEINNWKTKVEMEREAYT